MERSLCPSAWWAIVAMVTRGLRTRWPLKGRPMEARVQEISEQTETPCLAGGGARAAVRTPTCGPGCQPRHPCSPARGSGAYSGGPRSSRLSDGRADGCRGELRRRSVSQSTEEPATSLQ